ncbi:arginyl-tRNA synthetase [Spiroplasma helicoides]|uniref:Arginine--tRNA ligase n=1 Tax=Spiroplasma helicoides TaxID=216938 RepID=A0A1B3SJQ9_9MOLU|nr:arginine--tRNA ligase [Spiroplasma helicoides]AOG60158.1 arginyl-tRNA synthetase [Spiroplasma helicoides]
MSIFIEKINNAFENILKKSNLQGRIIIEKPREESNGDFSTNFAMINSKLNNMKPLDLASQLVKSLNETNLFEKVEIAGPGFINMTMKNDFLKDVLNKIIKEKDHYGSSDKKDFKYNIEIVSANPTGYLHIGHARNGSIGDSVARMLKFLGYQVETEHYTNDAGNQINISASTLFYQYLKLLNIEVQPPEEMYGGDMYVEVAKLFLDKYGDKFKDNRLNGNIIDDEEVHKIFRKESISFFLEIIKNQLKMLGVQIDLFSSEAQIYAQNEVEKTLSLYENLGKTYWKDDALWIKTTELGDDKDRVLKKANGEFTYISGDLASHNVRFQRSNANKYVNFWGADHHGYIPRIKAGLTLLGYPKDILEIDIYQMVRVIKDGQEVKMSKRRGTAIWLIDLIEMVGKDSTRYMLVSKPPTSHMDFDLDLVMSKNSANPVYYAQYATARAFKILEKAQEHGLTLNNTNFNLLDNEKEKQIIMLLDSFNKTIEYAATSRLPSVVCDYIQNLAKKFHSYYSEFKFFDEQNKELSTQRCILVEAIYQVLSNAFNLIGIDVVNEM